ncbi:baculoviral IAP repeat-containing protein 3-like [Phlebotomus argentipes]|uniref:baculoviral IAP repeat-containing protein 3-like n=1 Tax=Phlebotomus argentipes TaxID=94469 RepID=UPI00289337FD|nr:baculoviral IAP repeat-containing protein 3-like [Phlebotomus argentipes]
MSDLNLFKERDRLTTFEACPLDNIDTGFLAKLGFYYDTQDRAVKCKFCDLSFDVWREEYRNPLLYHRVFSPVCPIVTHQAHRNDPLVVDDLTRVRNDVEDVSNCCNGPNEHYVTLESRLESFSSWPVAMQTRPEDLASAGFYYSGRGDIVFCFVCGLRLNQWRVSDDPHVRHAKMSHNCEFLRSTKGQDFIQGVLQAELERQHELESQNYDDLPDDELCSVCYLRRRAIVCVPCGHFVMCEQCSDFLANCPLCGQTLWKKIPAIIL